MRRRRSLSLVAVALVAGQALAPAASAASAAPAPVGGVSAGADAEVVVLDDVLLADEVADVAVGGVVADRWLVTVRAEEDPETVLADHVAAGAVGDGHVYDEVLHGFVVTAVGPGLARLRSDVRVARVEPDRVVTGASVQSSAPWGLDRIDQRQLPLDGAWRFGVTGRGVTVYVIDSGVRPHDQFGTRLKVGFTSIPDGGETDDCVGHGTHVAGIAGGSVHGVAKQVDLVPVRVLDCAGSGTTSTVVAGVDWVAANHRRPAVATMSLGGTASNALDEAVRRATAAGVTMVVAAGNGDGNGNAVDACTLSPARVDVALTVAAVGRDDRRAPWSNTGTCVDVFAPGVGIASTWITSASASAVRSGTSMAAPHVAGVAALLLGSGAASTPAQVRATLLGQATTGQVLDAGAGSANRLLFWQAPPVISVDAPASGQLPRCTTRRFALVGDWDGSGRDGVGWFCDGRVRLRTAGGAVTEFAFGRTGDVPVVADWDRDGIDTVSLVRDGTWMVNDAVGAGRPTRTFDYGRASRGDVPIAGRWRSAGSLPGFIRDTQWHLRFTATGGQSESVFTYGRLSRGDRPLVGDWNADGRETIGIVRDGEWHLRDELSGGPAPAPYVYGRVLAGDVPVVGDWTGDGRATPGIVRDGQWHLKHQHGSGRADRVLSFPAP